MKNRSIIWLNKKFPRNYLIENPVAGAVINAIFCFIFILLYKPLQTKASPHLSFEITMAVYSIGSGLALILFVWILDFFKWFSDIKEWTILREIVSVILILTGIGTIVYLMGFLIETPAGRINIETYLDSVGRSFLLGLFPFFFFSALNYRYLSAETDQSLVKYNIRTTQENPQEEQVIRINSKLKKEELSFNPADFIYAEADGNYVVFHILKNNDLKKEIIRNSISNIEQQLAELPFIIRTHRAFIVNLKKVKTKQGNILGYQLKLSGTDFIIPVSRNNIRKFDEALSIVRQG
jgi:hypothetical protein